jgi:hypothetical protein
MKKLILILVSGFATFLPLMAQHPSHFPKITPAGKGIVDTRIDNIAYWKKMIQLGYVIADPYIPVEKPVYSSSGISGKGINPQDSPDVPITDQANTTQSENSVFVDPYDESIVLNSNNSTDWVNNNVENPYGADGLFSNDAGQSWGGALSGAGQLNSGDPSTAISLNGWWYVGDISYNWGQGIAWSTDQGTTWTYVEVASVPQAGGPDILDKNHLCIDIGANSPFEGYLYDSWMNGVGTSPNFFNIEISRSVNHGLTWSAPLNISSADMAGDHDQGVNLSTGPNGEVYAVWSIYDAWPADEAALGFARSADGGATFIPATRIIDNILGIRLTGTSKNMRVNSFPSMAVDNSNGTYRGNLYVVWANHGVPGINTGSDISVYMIRSTDGGNTWSAPGKVNQDPSGTGKEHYFPWITCDPANGTLAVIYYDNRNVSATQCETWVSYSYDAGETWQDTKVSDVAFTPGPIPGLAGSYFGDYIGITSNNMKVYPVWTDNRTGRALSYTSPFTLGPAPNQAYIVYNSVDLSSITDHSGQNMNFGDSLHLSVGLKNIGDKPGNNLQAWLTSDSPYILITDSTENYGTIATGANKVITNGYSLKVSDTIPDGLKVMFNLRVTDGDSIWFSHFFLDAHAPALNINGLTVIDTTGNHNGKLDPGETVDLLVPVSNPGDFACPGTVVTLSSLSGFITVNSGTSYLDTLKPGPSKNAHFNITVSDEAMIGSYGDLSVQVHSGLYHAERIFHMGIGLIVEDWETGTFTKFDWVLGTSHPWGLTNIGPYEGIYCAKSPHIADQQLSELFLNYIAGANDSISFYRKTSSEPGYDFLQFFIDNTLMGKWSGETPWGRVVYPVSAGSHNFRWIYSKDIFASQGQDCAWVDFIVFPPPVLPAINAGPDDTICGGESYRLQGYASNYDSIRWITTGDGTFDNDTLVAPLYTPGTNDMISGLVTLKLTGYGPNGNVRNNMNLGIGNVPAVNLSVTPNDTVCAGNSITMSVDTISNGMYLWIPGGMTTPSIIVDTSVTHGINTTKFIVYVTNNWQCTGADSALIIFKACAGIEELEKSFLSEIYPNPNKGNFTLTIHSKTPESIDLKLINTLNAAIWEEKNIEVKGVFRKNFGFINLASGIYFLEIRKNEGNVVHKIVIQE